MTRPQYNKLSATAVIATLSLGGIIVYADTSNRLFACIGFVLLSLALWWGLKAKGDWIEKCGGFEAARPRMKSNTPPET